MTTSFQLRDGWHAIWHGQMATATFNCKGAADAWIDICNRLGRWRA